MKYALKVYLFNRNNNNFVEIFGSTLDCLCTNDFLYKMAVAGEGCIKIYNLNTWKEIKNERIELPRNAGKVTDLAWA